MRNELEKMGFGKYFGESSGKLQKGVENDKNTMY
jgi:hypothetical protein